MTIQDTIKLQDKIMQKYCDTEIDKEIITALCFARNIAEVVEVHFNKTNNKTEFYREILNNHSIDFSVGYQTLFKYYSYLTED